jgi:hypothetical protein
MPRRIPKVAIPIPPPRTASSGDDVATITASLPTVHALCIFRFGLHPAVDW